MNIYIEWSSDEKHGGGAWGFKKSVWAPTTTSPTKKSGPRRIAYYDKVKNIQKGDVVIHIQKKHFIGFSIAISDGYETEERPPDPGKWEYAKSFYKAELNHFVPFHKNINVNDVLSTKKGVLRNYLEKAEDMNLFYNNRQVNQGAYLTDADSELLEILFLPNSGRIEDIKDKGVRSLFETIGALDKERFPEGYDWVSFYKELAGKLLGFRDQQGELLKIISEANPDRQPIEDIDPFTFFAYINKIKDSTKRYQYLKSISNQISLESQIPKQFWGVPTAIGTNLRFFNSPEDIDSLWDFAEQVVHYPREEIRAELFSQCLGITNVAISKLTQGMFWLAPDRFLPFDTKTKSYLSGTGIRPSIIESLNREKDYRDYLHLLADVDEKLQKPYYEISHKAHVVSVGGNKEYKFEPPFDRMFESQEEADQAFDLLGRGVELLGLGPDDVGDRRIACTLQERGRKCILRVNYCSWAVLAVIRDTDGKLLFEFACRDDLVPEENLRNLQKGFAATIDGHVYHLTHIPFETTENYESAYELSIQAIKKFFARHKATPWRQFHRPELFHAFFDQEARRSLLKKGEIADTEIHEDDVSVPELENEGFSFDTARDAGGLYFPGKMRETLNSRINAALKTGKHIILIGPPGTGKSKLAKHICLKYLGHAQYRFMFTTATSDWTTYDTIGGLAPDTETGGEQLAFKQGVFLDCFKNEDSLTPANRWLIIDEINRADIDKAFGALFSVLAGDSIILPYKIEKERIRVRPQGESEDFGIIPPHEYVMPDDWRIVATMNTFDKTSLYEMSYAFMRRFAFIPVGVPQIPADKGVLENLITEYCKVWYKEEISGRFKKEIGILWKRINDIRTIGPAIIKDMLDYRRASNDEDWASALIMYVFPQFEGLQQDKQVAFINNEDIGTLCGNSHDEIIEHAADFFGIEKEKFDENTSENT